MESGDWGKGLPLYELTEKGRRIQKARSRISVGKDQAQKDRTTGNCRGFCSREARRGDPIYAAGYAWAHNRNGDQSLV